MSSQNANGSYCSMNIELVNSNINNIKYTINIINIYSL